MVIKLNSRKWTNGTGSLTYNSWRAMRKRVLYGSEADIKYYANKGISICQRWLDSFDNFVDDMGERPEGTTLDRINPNGNYEPSNCRWATMRVQQNNKFDLTEIKHDGQIKTIGEWAFELDLDERQKNTVYKRHSKYGAKTYDELFCDNLYSYRKSQEKHVCSVCKCTESKKWRKSTCANCYAKAFRYFKKQGSPIDISMYINLIGGENE